MIIKGQFSLFLHKNICCGYSLDSNEYPQRMFFMENRRKLFFNYHQISILSVALWIVKLSKLFPLPFDRIKRLSEYSENSTRFQIAKDVFDLHCKFHHGIEITIKILSFWTNRPGQTVSIQIRLLLIRVYTVCNSVCIFWSHDSMVEPHWSN